MLWVTILVRLSLNSQAQATTRLPRLHWRCVAARLCNNLAAVRMHCVEWRSVETALSAFGYPRSVRAEEA